MDFLYMTESEKSDWITESSTAESGFISQLEVLCSAPIQVNFIFTMARLGNQVR